MRREGVAERVRGDVLRDAAGVHVLAKDLPGPHAGERTSASIQEEDSLPLAFFQSRPELSQVHGHRADGGPADRHETLLAPLAEDSNEALLEEQVSHAEGDPLRHSEAGAVRQLEERPVAEHHVVVESRCGDESLHLVDG